MNINISRNNQFTANLSSKAIMSAQVIGGDSTSPATFNLSGNSNLSV